MLTRKPTIIPADYTPQYNRYCRPATPPLLRSFTVNTVHFQPCHGENTEQPRPDKGNLRQENRFSDRNSKKAFSKISYSYTTG